MFKTLNFYFKQNKSLIIAAIVSLLLHAFLLSKFSLTLPVIKVDQKNLELHLVNLKPSKINTSEPIENISATPVPKVSTLPKKITTEPKTLPSESSLINSAENDLSTQDQLLTDNTLTETVNSNDQESLTPSPDEITEIIDDSVLANSTIKPTTPSYKYVETIFEVYRGGDASAAGETRNIFNIDKNGTYLLSSITEAKGLASLIFGKLTQKSEGTVSENGLIPSFFYYQYGNDQAKTQTARFIWSDGVLQMHTVKGDKLEKLAEGTQDFLSFMYQFMFSPPLENMQITMTNGKYLRSYTYSFEGEETIHTKLGDLKTIHLLKAGIEEEKTEIWLGIDYQYIPIKIKKTEKDGNVIEQIATNIYTKLAD